MDRLLIIPAADGGNKDKIFSDRVPQGSVVGLILWNVFYDDLFSLETFPLVQLVGFTDDLAVIAMARTSGGLGAIVNPTLKLVDDWCKDHGLKLAHH